MNISEGINRLSGLFTMEGWVTPPPNSSFREALTTLRGENPGSEYSVLSSRTGTLRYEDGSMAYLTFDPDTDSLDVSPMGVTDNNEVPRWLAPFIKGEN